MTYFSILGIRSRVHFASQNVPRPRLDCYIKPRDSVLTGPVQVACRTRLRLRATNATFSNPRKLRFLTLGDSVTSSFCSAKSQSTPPPSSRFALRLTSRLQSGFLTLSLQIRQSPAFKPGFVLSVRREGFEPPKPIGR